MKTGAAAAAAAAIIPILPSGCLRFSSESKTGYFESEFGISDALCNKVLAKALSRGGDFADLFFEHTISNWVILEDGKVNQAYSTIALGVGIRSVNGDQVGYGYTQELTEEAMLAAASIAATIANSSATSPAGEFTPLVLENYYPLTGLLTDVPLESKLPIVQSTNDTCFDLSPLVEKVNVGFHDQQKRIMVITSEGIKAEDLLPRNYLNATVVAEKEGKRERAGWNLGGRKDFSYYTDDVIDEVARESVNRALVLFEAVQPPA